MKVNPSKFQVICISRNNTSLELEIGSDSIRSEKIVKLLGIHIDDKLDFNNHTSIVCKKAARQINALQRLAKHLNFESKLRIYESFVASNFVYCSIVYNSFSISQDRKMEKLNKRAVRLVCNDYISSYHNLLKKTGKKCLYVSKKITLIEFIFKVINGIAPPVDSAFFKKQKSRYDMRDNFKLIKPAFNSIKYGMKSVAYQGPLVWNLLPVSIKSIDDFSQFKRALRQDSKIFLCKCGTCMLCISNSIW